MAWKRGSDVFDPVAEGLLRIHADEVTKWTVLGSLIQALLDQNWDPEAQQASLGKFQLDPVIVAVFAHFNIAASTMDALEAFAPDPAKDFDDDDVV